jgi:hypothetical protein
VASITPEQIAVVAGIAVSIIIALLKLVPSYHDSPAVTKILTAAIAAVLTVGVQCSWVIGWPQVWDMLLMLAAALGTYKLVGQPIKANLQGPSI